MRIRNTVKNTAVGLIVQVLNTALTFISRTVFIYALGADYLGINGLFSNILSMLSLAELGVGSAIIYHMYKPLAVKDEARLKSLMKLYEKAYRRIGCIVGGLGILLVPFLNYIINDKPNVPNLTLIYLLFLANSVVSYFFVYKSAIITADQRNYIVNVIQQMFNFIQAIIQIIILFTTKNYILYLIIQIVVSIAFNLSISKKADSLYPFLKEKEYSELDKETKSTIFKHVLAMMSHKVGGVVVNSTDSILISTFVGVYWVGIYSNYLMIINMINIFFRQIFTALTASIGNLNAIENEEKSFDIYKKLLFLNFWIVGFCSICLWTLMNEFITLWIGNHFLLQGNIVFLIIVNFFLRGMRQTTIVYNTTLGLFWNDRYKPWIEAGINLLVSIVLLKIYGLSGVLLGTLISTVTTSLWVDPYILYKYGFKQKLSKYFLKYFIYIVITIIASVSTKFLTTIYFFNGNVYLAFVIKMLICLIVPNIVFILCCSKMDEFNYIGKLALSTIKKLCNF